MDRETLHSRFPDAESCLRFLERVRWRGGRPRCPYCGRSSNTSKRTEARHYCSICNSSFGVTVGTPLHGTRLDLREWVLAITDLIEPQRGESLSVRSLATRLQINKNTAERILRAFRRGLLDFEQRAFLNKIAEGVRDDQRD